MFADVFHLNHPISTALRTDSVDNFIARGVCSKNKCAVGSGLSVLSEY